MQQTRLQIAKIHPNTGQIDGLPKNPRFIKDDRFEKLVQSIRDDPEMLELRELIVFPIESEKYVVIAGNMRLRAIKELGHKFAPVKILSKDTPAEKLRAYAIKDNVPFGDNDYDALANEWDMDELENWGMEKKESVMAGVFNNVAEKTERFNYPITFIATEEEYFEWKEIKKEIGIDDDTKALFHIIKTKIIC